MGNPPPHAAVRGSVGMPANSDGSLWMKLKKSCVETPKRAVYALRCAISMVGTDAPSIRPKALRLPPSSRIATFSVTPSCWAFASAAFTMFCASSWGMLCFLTTLVMSFVPPPDMCCGLIDQLALCHCPSLSRKAVAEHGPTALRFGLRRFVLNHVPMLDQNSIDHTNEVRNDPVL